MKKLFLILFAISQTTHALNQSEFLEQVKLENAEVRGLKNSVEIKKSILESRTHLFLPAVFGAAGHLVDQKKPVNSTFTYDKVGVTSVELGIEKLFEFGLQSKLSLKSVRSEITNASSGTGTFNSTGWTASPMLELKLPLLANSFGQQYKLADALEKEKAELEILQAELAYLSKLEEARMDFVTAQINQDLLKVQSDALVRVKDIYLLVKNKADRNLEQASSLLQTRAVLDLATIDYKTTETKALLAIEKLRNWLESLPKPVLANYAIQEITNFDVDGFRNSQSLGSKLFQKALDLETTGNSLKQDAQSSELNLIGSHAVNGTGDNQGTSFQSAQRSNEPSTFIGLQFRVPLSFGRSSRLSQAYTESSQSLKDRKQHEQNTDARTLALLSESFKKTKELMILSASLEKSQLEKLRNEKKLLSQGRSSIYQVLQFELDFTRAQAGKFNIAMELEGLKNRLQLYRYK